MARYQLFEYVCYLIRRKFVSFEDDPSDRRNRDGSETLNCETIKVAVGVANSALWDRTVLARVAQRTWRFVESHLRGDFSGAPGTREC